MNRNFLFKKDKKAKLKSEKMLSYGQLVKLINNKLDEIEKSAYETEKL